MSLLVWVEVCLSGAALLSVVAAMVFDRRWGTYKWFLILLASLSLFNIGLCVPLYRADTAPPAAGQLLRAVMRAHALRRIPCRAMPYLARIAAGKRVSARQMARLDGLLRKERRAERLWIAQKMAAREADHCHTEVTSNNSSGPGKRSGH
ncbi:MAG: hypothetical protein ACYDHY_10010 [Acidiferrobacterales bacterium]